MLNKESKRLSTQMIKFVYLFSKSSLSVLNMIYKHDAGTDDIRLYTSNYRLSVINTDTKHDSLHVHWHPSYDEIVSK